MPELAKRVSTVFFPFITTIHCCFLQKAPPPPLPTVGLGADASRWVQQGKIFEKELFDRYWCYHMACAQDACWALYVGREFGIPSGQSDPHALAELGAGSNVIPLLDCMAWRQPGGCDTETQTCLTFTTFLWSCSLMKISRKIMSLMYVQRETLVDFLRC